MRSRARSSISALVVCHLLLLAATASAQSVGFASPNASNVTDALRDAITDAGNAVVDASSGDLRLGPSVSAALSIGAGLAACFFGHRLLRPTMFLCGFLVGGFACASAATYVFDGKSYENTAWWIALGVGGLALGMLVVTIYKIGVFIVGAAGGVMLAVALNTSVGYKLFPDDPKTALIVLAVALGLLCGLLAFMLEKPVIVVATSLVGAVLAVSGVGYFAKNFPDITDVQKEFGTQDPASGDWVYDLPSVWWAYLAGMLGLFLLGMFVQFRKTSLGAGSGYHSGHHDYA